MDWRDSCVVIFAGSVTGHIFILIIISSFLMTFDFIFQCLTSCMDIKVEPNLDFRARRAEPRACCKSSNYWRLVLRLTVACMRGFGEHRRAKIWLSVVSECERSEARGPKGFPGPSAYRLVRCWFLPDLKHYSFFAPNARRARRED